MSNVWYGSLINRIEERTAGPKPEVGMGVTECCYSDREPYEIIEVKDEKHITVREMSYERIDNNGMSECQEYRYFSNPDGAIVHLVLRNGRWRNRIVEPVMVEDPNGEYGRINDDGSITHLRKVGTRVSNKLGCNGWHVGRAEHYYDFSF